MSPIMIIPILIIVGSLFLGLNAFLSLRRERMAQIGTTISKAALFEQGLHEAQKKKSRGNTKQSRLTLLLHKAGLTLSDTTFILTLGAITGFCGVFGTTLGGIGVGSILACAIPLATYGTLRHLGIKKSKQLNAQLLKAYTEIVTSIKSSMTLKNAIRASTEYIDDPLRTEFIQVCADVAVDVDTPLSKALADMALRTQNPHVRNLSIGVQKQESQKGASLAPLIESLIEDINDNLNAQRERDTQVANMRFNRTMLALFVPGTFIFMCAMNPKWLHFYTSEPLGWAVIGIALISEIMGLVLSNHIMKIR